MGWSIRWRGAPWARATGVLLSLWATSLRAQLPTTAPIGDSPARAADADDSLSLTLGADFVTAYYFRGIPQENQGFIAQPYGSIGLRMLDEAAWFNDVTFALGTWNSLQTGPTGEGNDPSIWYESDILVTVSATVAEEWTVALGSVAYTSPNDSYNTYQEINLAVSYDDSQLLGAWALHPRILVAWEIADQADSGNSAFDSHGTSRGTYLELGIAPELPLDEREGAWNLVFPATLGLSLNDYYETPDGDNETFGFFDQGFELVVPLRLPGGDWTLRGGVHLIYLGENAAEIGSGIGGGEQFNVWGKLGITLSL